MFTTASKPRMALCLGVIAACAPALALKAAELHVPADYPTIQAAINAASNGDEVIVAPGTYSANPVAEVISKAITLRSSGGADVTFLTSPSMFSDTVRLVGVGTNTVFEGFTIRDSKAGVLNIGTMTISGAPTIRDCVFEANNIAGGSQPVIRGGATNGATITNCTFLNNGAAAIVLFDANGLTIDGCTFISNNAFSSAFRSLIHIGSGATIQNCEFVSNNSFDGTINVFQNQAGSVVITDCQFTGNTAGNGGGVYAVVHQNSTGSVSIIDSTFDGNSASASGGGAYLQGANCSAIGCTFTNNTASGSGGGLVLRDAATAVSCTISGNQAALDGGGVMMLGMNAAIINCNALNNTAGGAGGGVRIGPDITATINDSFLCENVPDQFAVNGILQTSGFIACTQFGPTLGACCLSDGSCVTLTQAHCAAVGGTYHGDNTSCAEAPCSQPCTGDVNADGLVNVTDLLQVISAWGKCP